MGLSLKKRLIVTLLFIIFLILLSFNFKFLVWFAFSPLIILIYKEPLKKILPLIFAAALLASLFSLTWVTLYNITTYLITVFFLFSFLFLFMLISNISFKKIEYPLAIFIPSIVWLILLFVFSFTIVSSDWATLSLFHPMTAPLIWYIGSYGITFLIVLINSIVAFYLIKKDKKLLLFGSLLALIFFSCFIYSYTAIPKGEKLKVALIQGNFPQPWGWRVENADNLIFKTYKNLTLESAKEKPDLIIWPEYAIPNDILKNKNLFEKISNLSKQVNSYIVLGSLKWYDTYYNGKERFRSDIALVFSNNGSFIDEYVSVKPIPFEKWTLPGKELKLFNINNKKFGIITCYEETQGFITKYYSNNNADFFIAIVNNQRFDNSRGLYLSNLFSRLRAAENNKYLIRTTNTGITRIINPNGKEISKLDIHKRGFLIEDIYV